MAECCQTNLRRGLIGEVSGSWLPRCDSNESRINSQPISDCSQSQSYLIFFVSSSGWTSLSSNRIPQRLLRSLEQIFRLYQQTFHRVFAHPSFSSSRTICSKDPNKSFPEASDSCGSLTSFEVNSNNDSGAGLLSRGKTCGDSPDSTSRTRQTEAGELGSETDSKAARTSRAEGLFHQLTSSMRQMSSLM